jgi:hypothetical protein
MKKAYGSDNLDFNLQLKDLKHKHMAKSLKDKEEKFSCRQFMRKVYEEMIYTPVVVPDRKYYKFKVTRLCYKVAEMKWFQSIIFLSIVINTIILSLD